MPTELKIKGDGSGIFEAVKVPDCELVMLFPEVKSVGVHTPLGQKYSWIFWGVGAVPLGRVAVKNSEKPPL